MLSKKTIAVVVPAYDEENQILHVLETMPGFVDKIVLVNDCSRDRTSEKLRAFINRSKKSRRRMARCSHQIQGTRYNRADIVAANIDMTELEKFPPSAVYNSHPERDRFILIDLEKNSGVGAAIARGYKWCKDYNIDCTAVMAGDGQMDPAELQSICKPVIEDGIDYVKGNRLIHRSAWLVVPRIRYLGNSVLSIMSKLASGYWHVSDTQTGYTAISLKALKALPLYKIYKRYGMPNDMLVKLNIAFCTLKEVEIKPIYNVGEKSKMKILKVIWPISFLLVKSFVKRLWIKYLFRDFHPLFLLYNFAFFLCICNIPFIIKILESIIRQRSIPNATLFAFVFLFISSFQSLLFAMWMDIQDNERLYK